MIAVAPDRVVATDRAAAAATMVELVGVAKRYGSVDALHPTDLTVARGEFVTLLGPSGSGKSTILNLIAGMASPSAGRIMIDGCDATTIPASARGLGMVFQNYALMPHMTVFENIAFPLQVRRVPKAEIRQRVAASLDLIELRHVADRRPRELSGGQQQRVSLARCIVYNPSLILMDEPLGALDKKLRESMQLEIKRLHAEVGITILYVTHDQDEALTMSDRIVLLNHGRIEQFGRPDELYFAPKNVFCADFIGSSNLIPGTLEESAGGLTVMRTALGTVPVMRDAGWPAGERRATLLIRPENVTLTSDDPDLVRVGGRLEDSIIMGGVVRHFVRCAGETMLVVQELNRPGAPRPRRGDPVRIGWAVAHGRLLTPSALERAT